MTLIYIGALFGGWMVHDELEKMNTMAPKMKGQGAQKYNSANSPTLGATSSHGFAGAMLLLL